MELWNAIFGGDAPGHQAGLGQIAARTALIYCFGLLLVRLGQRRLLSRTTPFDMLNGFILGSLLSRGMNGSAGVPQTLVACLVLVGLRTVLAWAAARNHKLGALLKGKPIPLIREGQLVAKNFKIEAISHHDLEEEMRLKLNTEDLSQVRSAYVERNGEISVVRR